MSLDNPMPVSPLVLCPYVGITHFLVPIAKPNNFLDDRMIEVYFYGAC